MVEHVVQALQPPAAGQLVKGGDVPVGVRSQGVAHVVAADEARAARHEHLRHASPSFRQRRAYRGLAPPKGGEKDPMPAREMEMLKRRSSLSARDAKPPKLYVWYDTVRPQHWAL